jgi:hypothetical protein
MEPCTYSPRPLLLCLQGQKPRNKWLSECLKTLGGGVAVLCELYCLICKFCGNPYGSFAYILGVAENGKAKKSQRDREGAKENMGKVGWCEQARKG